MSAPDPSFILVDAPAPMVRRIALNRPEKRNALNAQLQREILTATDELDRDPEVRVTIKDLGAEGVTDSLTKRDNPFGDYRAGESDDGDFT